MYRLFVIGFLPLLLSSISALGLQASSGLSPSVERSGSISGRVIGDDGQPVPHAFISIERRSGLYRGAGGELKGDSTSRQTLTDDRGLFRVADLAPAVYRIAAMKAGFAESIDSGRPKYYRIGDSVTLNMIRGGVITGKVTTSDGEPVIGVVVQVFMARDVDGRLVGESVSRRPAQTDDRGIYRIHSLRPGTYLVVANYPGFFPGRTNPFEAETPTYFPSSSRDTAAEVSVHGGQELGNIDIRYRGDRGYTINGIVSYDANRSPKDDSIQVRLIHAASGAIETSTSVERVEAQGTFSFPCVQEAEYELEALSNEGEGARSQRRHVTVRGGDVGGVALVLEPLGSIAGRVILAKTPESEPNARCTATGNGAIEQNILGLRLESTRRGIDQYAESSPNENGNFLFRGLYPGRYRLETPFLNEDLYTRAVSLQSEVSSKNDDNAGRPISVQPGRRVEGLTVTIAEGAASLRGRVVAASEGLNLPQHLRIHAVPSDREQADNLLRYAETNVRGDGAFELRNLAPGHYWLFAREAPVDGPDEASFRPASWNASKRLVLRREAETSGKMVDLRPCQHWTDYLLRFGPNAAGKTQN